LRSLGKNIETDENSILPMWSGDARSDAAATELVFVATQGAPGNRSGANRTTRAGYIVSEIKQHKRSAALVVVLLLAAVAVVVYVTSGSKGTNSKAINSVAVLPFVNESADPRMEFLSDGISESLIDSLSRLPQLKVTARYSSFKYRGKEADPQEIAKALGVQAIVIGRVVQRGDQLQVRVELIDTRDKTQMWGEQYNRKAIDFFAVQSEISQQIAEKLRLRLTNAEQQQIVNEAKANPQAAMLVLEGRFYGMENTKEGLGKYIELCNQAITIDPNYALAYVRLADAYRLLSLKEPQAALKAEEAALRALQLDDSFAEAHYILAQLKGDAWVWGEAERENKRAIELNPSLADAHYGYAFYLSSMGRHVEAVAEQNLAKELNPLLPRVIVSEGVMLYNARQYDQAIEKYRRALDVIPAYIPAHEYLGYAYAMKGMYGEAIAEYKEALKHGDNPSAQCYMGYAMAMSGQRNEALAILKQLQSGQADYVSPAELAILYAGLGEKEQALAALEKAYAAHDSQMQYLKVEPHYDSLRSDPRFTDLLRKVGLTP
jgi:TolB-like protein/Tfp pilus assembly protein PilF